VAGGSKLITGGRCRTWRRGKGSLNWNLGTCGLKPITDGRCRTGREVNLGTE